MKKFITTIFAVVLMCSTVQAQGFSPESYNLSHSDSCWYVTLNYRINKMPKNDELILVSQICCPDTCVNDTTRRFQGRRYAKRYTRQYGYTPELGKEGVNSYTLAIPEEMVTDTLIGVVYSEYISPDGISGSLDTVEIILPMPAALSCHPVKRQTTIADQLAYDNPYVSNMSGYIPVVEAADIYATAIPASSVHFPMNSQRLDPSYWNNAHTIDSIVQLLTSLANGSGADIESVQIVGFTSPDLRDNITPKLGYKRAAALCKHLQQRTNLPDSVFEVADGGKHWHLIYTDLEHNTPGSDTLINRLQAMKSNKERIAYLQKYNGGKHYAALCNDSASTNYRSACCTRVYYHNLSDSSSHELNSIVAELANNPHPDYETLRKKLSAYSNDPRALNIKGVIDHRQHRRAAAAEAFRRAAAMGDEQAMRNMDILGLSME